MVFKGQYQCAYNYLYIYRHHTCLVKKCIESGIALRLIPQLLLRRQISQVVAQYVYKEVKHETRGKSS